NLVSLIRHVVIQFLNEPKYENYSLNFNYSEESFYVDVDEVLLKRVFINLITNAIIHNDASIVINISIFKTDANYVTILIEDDGKGISPIDLEYIFNRYYRGTNTSQATEGSGLGMAIAHDIIKIHNGNIHLESELNQGTQIKITLPITKKL
ncbi:MAG: sensor histidine kinase, partial [Turicibacter sp.]